ncbi:MAG: hemolysin [Candidatus Lumbricidophila eiseniae]|uniref:Hemolysin n=1 Tax=Candidatus Lumbricidiphila eiseniae TaxID=1969409 RepID=A0A2A6FRM0_9MICO|nr:MAG: hemolysin [Candidatus Lumbricidophila eiseniae]
MESWLFFLAAFALIAFGGLMAAIDSALGVISRSDVTELAFTSRARRSLLAIAADTVAHVNAINFVRIIAETTAGVLVTLGLTLYLSNTWLVLLVAALAMTAVSFVLVGASPRSVGRMHANLLLPVAAPLAHLLRVIVGPLANALVSLGNRVTPGRTRFAGVSSEEQLLSIVDEATELEVLEKGDRERIHSIFEFSDTIVREVMVPRTDMVTIDAMATGRAAMSLFLTEGYSRIPVVDGEVDEVCGILYLRDVARSGFDGSLDADTSVGNLARPAVFVPESMKADALLAHMQRESTHLAMVVDEYGGIAGLVTLEDLIEELVGDISDEHDHEEAQIEKLGRERYRVNARVPISDLGELFELDLEDDDVDSVGGLLAKELGRIPKPGDRVQVSGLLLTAERTKGQRKRIDTVLVTVNTHPSDAMTACSDADGPVGEADQADTNRTARAASE